MTLCRISKLEIQGFRAFGRAGQTVALPSQLAALWGANSQGKTSLAEAVEFLLTGQIVRRSLMASSQDEFADSLRNAHLPHGEATFVEAVVDCCEGAQRTLRRTLKTDYSKKQDCETVLEIDGRPATETALAGLGIVLSQPPLRAPVLAQHTLGYLFSARPQDRATYFKALLEVTDLEEFRGKVAALDAIFHTADGPLLRKLDVAESIPRVGRFLKSLSVKVPTGAGIDAAVGSAMKELIESHGETAAASLDERTPQVEILLAEKRARTFPLKGFDRKPLPPWREPTEEQVGRLQALIDERTKVDEDARRLIGLFREALALPSIEKATEAIDCPLCGTEDTLTPKRVAFLRSRIADTEAYQFALKAGCEALAQIETAVTALRTALTDALPIFITNPSKFRRTRGFRVERVRALLGAEKNAAIDAWLWSLSALVRARGKAAASAGALLSLVAPYNQDPDKLLTTEPLTRSFEDLRVAYVALLEALVSYEASEKEIYFALKTVVDAESDTAGWQELVDLARDGKALREELIDRSVRAEASKELAAALRQIDKGNELVLDDKFGDLSDDVQKWWDLLRPDELSFFLGVKPRPGARRTIDFKAGLSANADRSDAKLRDVVAVFSQSQLHCLGLSLFLARSVNEGCGFVVLDDPILSSDEDYRAFFNAAVVEELIKLGIQVIVLTQDQRTWKDLGERYLHRNISLFQIILQTPLEGTTVIDSADDLDSQFVKADKLVRSGIPDLHKQAGRIIRESAERLCKELLVRDQRAKGQAAASLNDYSGKNLGHLEPLVSPLLVKDGGDPGKLRTIGIAVNPANHDDAVPSAGDLKVALGNLRTFKKQYF